MALLFALAMLGASFETRVQEYMAIRDTHPTLVEGTLFHDAEEDRFRGIVSDLLAVGDLILLRRESDCTAVVRVNAPLPRNVSHFVPARLLFRFPALPPELFYRIVNADLVVWDEERDVVVDVLRDLFVVPSYA